MNSAAPNNNYRSIQVLRAFAACMVVIFHSQQIIENNYRHQFDLGLLNSGVDIFFVISGFVIMISTKVKKNTPQFIKSRLIRIAPMYWIATLVMVGVLALQHTPPALNELIYSCLFIPYGSTSGQMVPVLGQGWTLNYEMFFYILFALTLTLGSKRQLLIFAMVFSALVLIRPIAQNYGAFGFRLTSPLFFEFLIGAILAMIVQKLNNTESWIGIPIIIAGYALGIALALAPINLPRTLYFGFPAALVVAGAIIAEKFFRNTNWQPIWLIGDASYSIYLFHTLIIAGLRPILSNIAGPFAAISLFCAAVIGGIFIYLIIERRIVGHLKKVLGLNRN